MTKGQTPMDHSVHAWLIAEMASAGAVIGGMFGIVPPLVSLMALVWYGMMIYDWCQGRRTPMTTENPKDERPTDTTPGPGHNSGSHR